MRLEALCLVRSPVEQAVHESLLRACEIEFWVDNDHFGSLEVGPVIPLFNQKCIRVRVEDLSRAREFLCAMAKPVPEEPGQEPSAPPDEGTPWARRRRLGPILETLLFGWFIPGRR